MPPWVLALADDLTGALEIGAKFAAEGIPARVSTQRTLHEAPDVPVLVLDTETRHLPERQAASVVRDLAIEASRFSPWLIYKKTDSTLRGHIAAEFQALLQVFPERKLAYAPAYPEMGRTVRDGTLYVHGVPVHLTEFASDSLNPVRVSDFGTLLNGVPVTLHQGESDADVHFAAKSVLASETPPLAAGPAALAAALAHYLPVVRTAAEALPRLSRCLIVNGSQHPISLSQIEAGQFDESWRYFEPQSEATGTDRAAHIGQQIRLLLPSFQPQGLIVLGGDTAFGIHRALGSHLFQALGEVLPGVPISRSAGLFWITKAGGFGAPDILCDIRNRFT